MRPEESGGGPLAPAAPTAAGAMLPQPRPPWPWRHLAKTCVCCRRRRGWGPQLRWCPRTDPKLMVQHRSERQELVAEQPMTTTVCCQMSCLTVPSPGPWPASCPSFVHSQAPPLPALPRPAMSLGRGRCCRDPRVFSAPWLVGLGGDRDCLGHQAWALMPSSRWDSVRLPRLQKHQSDPHRRPGEGAEPGSRPDAGGLRWRSPKAAAGSFWTRGARPTARGRAEGGATVPTVPGPWG